MRSRLTSSVRLHLPHMLDSVGKHVPNYSCTHAVQYSRDRKISRSLQRFLLFPIVPETIPGVPNLCKIAERLSIFIHEVNSS